MDWRNKARIAKWVAALPPGISYSAYYFLQRHFGELGSVDPVRCLKAGVRILELIENNGPHLNGSAAFLEVGTGRTLGLPIALWLCGAARIITVDLNRYLKKELVFEEIDYIAHHLTEVRQVFGCRSDEPVFVKRMALLVNGHRDLDSVLSMINTRYLAPADAGKLDLPCHSIDYHISYMVDQHVRPEALLSIVVEGRRLLSEQGLFIHYSTLSDLFAGVDSSISRVNFLQFREQEWEAIAGNRYMYHNRLRVDELAALWRQGGARILEMDCSIDPESLQVLQSGTLVLDPRFREKSPETNATRNAWIVAAPA
jgi:hypothetical protein